MQNGVKEYISGLKNEFVEVSSSSYVKLDSGELFTLSEYEKYVQKKSQKYIIKIQDKVKSELSKDNIEYNQKIIDVKNIRQYSKNKNNNKKQKAHYDGGEFNMAYRERVGDFHNMKLNSNEKLTYYVLRDFIQYPTNCVVINGLIPTIKDFVPLIGLSDRTIKKCIVSLENKNIIKRQQYGRRKAIYINPEYFASGKDLDIETLKMFDLIELDEDKINSYI